MTLYHENKMSETELFRLVKDNDHMKIKRLIYSGIYINQQDSEGFTPLMIASKYGHIDTVKLLLDFGANPDIQNNKGNTALICACAYGHLGIVKELLYSGGANIFIKNVNNNSAMYYAMCLRHKKILDELKCVIR